MRRTPPLNARGIYQLIHPFSVPNDKIYRCYAIRSFKDIYELGQDVFTDFYVPMGISSLKFNEDAGLKATIITLISDEGDVVYVPDTYIQSYPDMGFVNYHHLILSVDLGPIPEYVDLTFLRESVNNIVMEIVGVDATSELNNVPYSGVITANDHETLEAARLNNINVNETERAKYLNQLRVTDALTQRIAVLEKIVTDNGLLP